MPCVCGSLPRDAWLLLRRNFALRFESKFGLGPAEVLRVLLVLVVGALEGPDGTEGARGGPAGGGARLTEHLGKGTRAKYEEVA